MRLTLRTLLAYLDDTLEPGEIKTIGQKVAESDAAQELVAKIKQVTRRRRLTTPTDVGPGDRFDANRVASYLDNELSGEELAEIEKICLESDVHLAEIAATHQILTLVLGEPALVPPTAKRRMYSLIHGKPKKSTKPPPVTKSMPDEASVPEHDGDDTLLALPMFRKAPWLRWALPVAALVLLGILGVVLWNNLGGPTDNRSAREKKEIDNQDDRDKTKTDDKTRSTDRKTDDGVKPADKDRKTDDGVKPADKDKKPDDRSKPPVEELKQPIPPVSKPNMERHPTGMFVSKEQVLVQRDGDTWKRIPLGDPVQTGEPVISLPGYKSELRLDAKIGLLLWGSLPELYPERLLESVVTLHHSPPAGIDAEVTLHRGRIYLTSRKDRGEARVRLRFWREEVWDIVLEEPDTMVGVDLVPIGLSEIAQFNPAFKPQPNEEPFIFVGLYVLKGRASLKVDRRTFGGLQGPVGPSLFKWDNKGGGLQGPINPGQKIPEWEPEQPLPMQPREQDVAKKITAALLELANALTRPEKPVQAALQEFMDDSNPERRVVGIRSLVAIDAIGSLIDVLTREEVGREDVRQEALFGLKNWLSRGLEQASKLYDKKTMTGLLSDKGFSKLEAEDVLYLLNGFTPEQRRQKETYELLILGLRHKKILIRDLAWRQLVYFARGQNIEYHPAAPPEVRERGADAWKKLLDSGKLPPPPLPMPPK